MNFVKRRGITGVLGALVVAAGAREVHANGARGEALEGLRWERVTGLGYMMPRCAVAVVDGDVWIIGSSQVPMTRVVVYDVETDTWRAGPALPEPRAEATAATVDGVLYVFSGGRDPRYATPFERTWLRLALDAREWVAGGKWSTRRSAAAAVMDGRIYMFGGSQVVGAYAATGELFDPRRQNGEELPAMSEARMGPALAAAGGVLYAAGGMAIGETTELGTPLASVEAFDPRVGRWEARAPMKVARGYTAGIGVRGHVVVAGGMVQPPAGEGFTAVETAAVEIYDPGSGVWRDGPPLPGRTGDPHLVEAAGRLYVFDGRTGAMMRGVFPDSPPLVPLGEPGVSRLKLTLAVLAAASALVAGAWAFRRRRVGG